MTYLFLPKRCQYDVCVAGGGGGVIKIKSFSLEIYICLKKLIVCRGIYNKLKKTPYISYICYKIFIYLIMLFLLKFGIPNPFFKYIYINILRYTYDFRILNKTVLQEKHFLHMIGKTYSL